MSALTPRRYQRRLHQQMGVTMSALRWDTFDDRLGATEAIPPAPSERTRDDRAAVLAGDDASSGGVVPGVIFSLVGFWLPLAAVIAWRRRIR